MKTTLKILVTLAVVFSMTSCKKLADVTFDATLHEQIDITTVATTTRMAEPDSQRFDETITLRLDDDASAAEYLSKINEVNVNSLTYKLLGYTGSNNVEISAKLYVDGNEVYEVNDLNLHDAVISGEIFTVPSSHFGAIASRLLNDKKIVVRYVGTSSANDPINFTVDVKSLLGITANALD